MLKTVDVLIGLTVVMLLASLIVTVLTQFITSVCNSRGRHLLHGVADLLQQVAPGVEREAAGKISAAVLTHPMIRAAGGRYGDVIQRGELTKILLELAADNGPQKLEAGPRRQRKGQRAGPVLRHQARGQRRDFAAQSGQHFAAGNQQ